MPHFGELQSLTGTLRSDGIVSRAQNSLTTDGSGGSLGTLLMRITETNVERITEDGTSREIE